MKIPAPGPTATASSTAGTTYLLTQHGAPLWLIATITILGIGGTLGRRPRSRTAHGRLI